MCFRRIDYFSYSNLSSALPDRVSFDLIHSVLTTVYTSNDGTNGFMSISGVLSVLSISLSTVPSTDRSRVGVPYDSANGEWIMPTGSNTYSRLFPFSLLIPVSSVTYHRNQNKVPYTTPLMVAMTMTSETNTTVFFVPMTLRITSIFGRLSAGPASSSARAGPLPMPLPINP